MKISLRVLSASLAMLSALFVTPAFATDTLYIPASAANPAAGDPDFYCYVGPPGISFTASQAATYCEVGFPLTIPVGHTIKQIAVIHADTGNFADPYIQTYLDIRQTFPPYSPSSMFFWDSTTPVPGGTVATTKLMAQVGKTYPDAFVVQMGNLYTVIVRVAEGARVDGLQITYE